MAHVITSPCDAIQHPLQNFVYKHKVCLRDDAIYSFGCFICNFLKTLSAVNYFNKHTDDHMSMQTVAALKVFYLPSNG